jgi:hypothetical protein
MRWTIYALLLTRHAESIFAFPFSLGSEFNELKGFNGTLKRVANPREQQFQTFHMAL